MRPFWRGFWEFYVSIDRFILNRVEKASHFLQSTFGIRSVQGAQLCYGGFISLVAGHDILMPLLSGGWKSIHWIFVAIFPFYLGVYLIALPHEEKMKDIYASHGLSNPKKILTRSIIARLVDIFFVIWMASIKDFWAINFTLLTISDYLLACDDLPPGKSRVRKWIDAIQSFGMKPVQVPQ